MLKMQRRSVLCENVPKILKLRLLYCYYRFTSRCTKIRFSTSYKHWKSRFTYSEIIEAWKWFWANYTPFWYVRIFLKKKWWSFNCVLVQCNHKHTIRILKDFFIEYHSLVILNCRAIVFYSNSSYLCYYYGRQFFVTNTWYINKLL